MNVSPNSAAGVPRYKFVCPKMIWDYNPETQKSHRKCTCDSPCTNSKCGRMIYIYPEKDLRAYPGTLRGTAEWDSIYKIRTTVERSINHFKDCFGLAGRKTQNEKDTSCRPYSFRNNTTYFSRAS